MQKESYEQYTKRIEGLANPVILSREEWEKETNPKQPEALPEPEPKQKLFSSTEQAHMLVLEEERKQSERVRLKPDDPLAIAWPTIGKTAEENTQAVRQSNEEAFRNLQAQEVEDQRASQERQKKLEKEILDQEHMAEQAAVLLAADRIKAGRKV